MTQQRDVGAVPAGPSLGWGGRLILGLIFAVGVALTTYLGITFGLIIGTMYGTDQANKPRPGIGMAPDLSGLVEMFIGIGAGGISGAVLGLLLGCLLMTVLCRYLLAPLLRKVPALVDPGRDSRQP